VIRFLLWLDGWLGRRGWLKCVWCEELGHDCFVCRERKERK
jgi:hypothetical protein